MAPIIYEKYKMKEFELRNTIDFNKIVTSNFLKLNKNTILDFKKNKNFFEDIYINYNDNGENIIFAKKGLILDENDQFIFKLENGFKLNFNENKEVEKLEFENYILKFENENVLEFNKFDRNTFTVFEDIQNKDYLNISYKLFDIIFSILIIIIFYNNNIIKIDYSLKNNLVFILLSVFVLILNQILKNSEVNFTIYLGSIFIIFIFCISFVIIRKKYV